MKILRFSAIWCMYCIYMRSFWEEMEKKYPGFTYEEYDADDHTEKHKEFSIKDVPTVIIFKDDKEIERIEGARDKDEVEKILIKYKLPETR